MDKKYTVDKKVWNFLKKHAPEYNLKEILDDYSSFGSFDGLIKFLTKDLPDPITIPEILEAILEGEDVSKIKADTIEIPSLEYALNIPKNLRKYPAAWWLQDRGKFFHRDNLLANDEQNKELNRSGTTSDNHDYRMCVNPDGSINKYGAYFKDQLAVRPILVINNNKIFEKLKPYIDLGFDYTINVFDKEWKFINDNTLIYSGEPILKSFDKYVDDYDGSDVKTDTKKWLDKIKSKVDAQAPKFEPYLLEIDLLTKDEFDALSDDLKKYGERFWLKTPHSTREVYVTSGLDTRLMNSEYTNYIRPVLVVSGAIGVDKIKLVNGEKEAIFNKISNGRYLLNNDDDSVEFSDITTIEVPFGKISKFNGSDIEYYLKNDLLDDYKQAKIEIA